MKRRARLVPAHCKSAGFRLIGTGDCSWRTLREGIKAIDISRISKFKLSADAVQLEKWAPQPTAGTILHHPSILLPCFHLPIPHSRVEESPGGPAQLDTRKVVAMFEFHLTFGTWNAPSLSVPVYRMNHGEIEGLEKGVNKSLCYGNSDNHDPAI